MTTQQSRKQIAKALLGGLVLLVMLVLVPFSIIFDNTNEQIFQLFDRNLSVNDDSSFWKYAYVIVTYHKSGHVLSHRLVTYLQQNAGFHLGGRLTAGERVTRRRNFNNLTKCSEISLRPGTVTVVEAPEFHCNVEELKNLFMRNPSPGPGNPKFGVKLVHLVRNPFSMAVSNYHYHSQDPTPEPYVHDHEVNPCQSFPGKLVGPGHDAAVDLVAPRLSNQMVEISGRMQPIMTRDDFDNIAADCASLWRTGPNLGDATYFDHLLALHPRDGLRMATADRFNHFALLANDLIMFRRVQKKVRMNNVNHPGKHNHFDVLTMSMDDWIDRPDRSMHDFLEFIFQNHMPESRKSALSAKYKKKYLAKSLLSEHITTGKNGDTADLMKYLRGDAVFGGPLARIEALLDEVLRSQQDTEGGR